MRKTFFTTILLAVTALAGCAQSAKPVYQADSNPIFRHKYTCDPAAMVEGNTLWLFTGQDEQVPLLLQQGLL